MDCEVRFPRSSSAPSVQNRYSMSGGRVDHDGHLEGKLGRARLALRAPHAPGISTVLNVAQHHSGLGRELGLHHHFVATKVEDADVFDVDRAFLDAGATGRTGPQDVRVDHTRHDFISLSRGIDASGGDPLERCGAVQLVGRPITNNFGESGFPSPRPGTGSDTAHTRCRSRSRAAVSRRSP